MNIEVKVRWGWLKAMYIYTLIGAGGFGLAILLIPHVIQTTFYIIGDLIAIPFAHLLTMRTGR